MKRFFKNKRVRAVVAVEMAVVTPLLLTMLFGIIEFGWLFTVRHTMLNAAREGARIGILPGATSDDVRDRANDLLRPMHLEGVASISVTEPTDEDPTVTVRISAPRAQVSLLGNFFGFTGGTVDGEASMRVEGV